MQKPTCFVRAIQRLTFLIVLLFTYGFSFGQDCSQANQNPLCAEDAPVSDSLMSNPFNYGCFDAQLTYFFTFHTGTTVGANVDLHVFPQDCDDFTGSNEINLIAFEITTGSDPCDPSNYLNASNCFGDTIDFTASLSNLTPDADYVVVIGSNHDLLYGPCTFSVNATGPGIDITASVSPFLITLGETAQLDVTGSNSGYTWSPGETLNNTTISNPTTAPETTTTFTVTSTIGQCDVIDQVTITVGPPIIIFNAFTPNNDGINDGWTIQGIQKFEDALVNVYDRWGQNVFRSLGYGKAWDGTNRGKYLPTAAYYYVIELNSPDVSIPPISGVVSIIH